MTDSNTDKNIDLSHDLEKIMAVAIDNTLHSRLDPLTLAEGVYALLTCWADIAITIIEPIIPSTSPPVIIMPEVVPKSDELEFVYPIFDYGYKLSAAKGSEAPANSSFSMCKLFYTIEKIIYLLIERLEKLNISQESYVDIVISGHELAKRKAFESVINLPHNVVISNFDPGSWGELYLKHVQNLANHGYEYPSTTPREV